MSDARTLAPARGVLRVLIVDDEPIARRGLRRLLAQRNDVRVVGECRDGADAVRRIRADPPDLVLLDVQMPGFDGFDVVRAVGVERMPVVVFVTAFDEFAVRAFEVAAVDYVVKPFSDERFAQAVSRALGRYADQRAATLHRRLLTALAETAETVPPPAPPVPSAASATRLLVTVGARSIVVPVDEIVRLQADDYCVVVHTAAGARYVMRESLTELERRLDRAQFLRVHRSAIVRLSAVKALQRSTSGAVVAVLQDGTRLAVSRSRRDAVIAALGASR